MVNLEHDRSLLFRLLISDHLEAITEIYRKGSSDGNLPLLASISEMSFFFFPPTDHAQGILTLCTGAAELADL